MRLEVAGGVTCDEGCVQCKRGGCNNGIVSERCRDVTGGGLRVTQSRV